MTALEAAMIPLDTARLCLDCKVITDGQSCPKCAADLNNLLSLGPVLDREGTSAEKEASCEVQFSS